MDESVFLSATTFEIINHVLTEIIGYRREEKDNFEIEIEQDENDYLHIIVIHKDLDKILIQFQMNQTIMLDLLRENKNDVKKMNKTVN